MKGGILLSKFNYSLINGPENNINEKLPEITMDIIRNIFDSKYSPLLEMVEYGTRRNQLTVFSSNKNRKHGLLIISHTDNTFKITCEKNKLRYVIISNIGRMDYDEISSMINKLCNLIIDNYSVGRYNINKVLDRINNKFFIYRTFEIK